LDQQQSFPFFAQLYPTVSANRPLHFNYFFSIARHGGAFGHRNKNGEGKNKKVKESHRRYAPPNTPLNANGHQHSYRRRFRVGKWTKENFIALAPFLDLSLVPLFVSCTLSLSGPSTNRDSSRRPYSCPQGLSRRTSHHPLG